MKSIFFTTLIATVQTQRDPSYDSSISIDWRDAKLKQAANDYGLFFHQQYNHYQDTKDVMNEFESLSRKAGNDI